MRQGTFELFFLGIAFLSLQFWWLKLITRKRSDEKILDLQKSELAKQKQALEKLLKK